MAVPNIIGSNFDDTVQGDSMGGQHVRRRRRAPTRVSYAGSPSAVNVDLRTERRPATEATTSPDFENVVGSPNNDTITGDAEDNVLNGGRGNDTITGDDGNDRLIGGSDSGAPIRAAAATR